MNANTTEKVKKAKFYVTAVSTALAGTEFQSTVRMAIGAFDGLDAAREFAEAQARRPEVIDAKSRIRFTVQHKGLTVARIEPERKGAI
ncbi:MAG: hypothetical protein PHP45_04690 [Elusimicrobiales bacterium]|nr:hypothetical protein [Elusimicrobiales bacterium]